MKKKFIECIFIFENGNVAVIHKNEQVPELQENPIIQLIKKARRKGYEVTEKTQIHLPNGKQVRKLKDYDNYEIL